MIYINLFGKAHFKVAALLLLRALGAVLGTGLHTALHALSVQSAADDVVTNARKILDTAAAHEHDGVLLQIVAALVQHVSSHEIAHGLTLEQGALVVSGIMFGAAIGKATIGILLDYLKPELTIVIYSAIGLAGWGLMAVATTPTPAIAAGFMAGLGQGVVLVALPWVIRKSFGQRDYSEILSIVSMFGAVASAIAVTAHGAVFDATGSYVPSLVGNMALYVVAAACMVIGFRMRPFKEITKQAK